jgi:outer membrane protein assembly factor BamB
MLNRRTMLRASLTILFTSFTLAGTLSAAQPTTAETESPSWPRFHGPNGDNHSTETGLLKTWPEGGPELLWTAEKLGFGYSSVTIAHDLVYTAGNVDEKTEITALTLDGKVRWQNNELEGFEGHMRGTRSTPTIDGERLYHKTPLGDVVCLNALTGKMIWGPVNILEKFKSKNIHWALSESLLIDGDNVICCPGGPIAAVVAFNKMTGKLVWQSENSKGPEVEGEDESDLAGYSSPILVEYGGLRIILTMTGKALIGVNADTGKLLFRFSNANSNGTNVANPIFHEGQVFISNGYKGSSAMVKLTVKGDKVTATEVWHSDELDNHHGGVILVDGYLYGAAHRCNRAKWICLDWKTGEMQYAEVGVGKGSATFAEGMLYTLSSRQKMGLVRATPSGHHLSGEFNIPELAKTTSRSHPVVCGGRLYIRHDEYLFVYDVSLRE